MVMFVVGVRILGLRRHSCLMSLARSMLLQIGMCMYMDVPGWISL